MKGQRWGPSWLRLVWSDSHSQTSLLGAGGLARCLNWSKTGSWGLDGSLWLLVPGLVSGSE